MKLIKWFKYQIAIVIFYNSFKSKLPSDKALIVAKIFAKSAVYKTFPN